MLDNTKANPGIKGLPETGVQIQSRNPQRVVRAMSYDNPYFFLVHRVINDFEDFKIFEICKI